MEEREAVVVRIRELRSQSVSEIALIRTVREEFSLSLNEAKRKILEADGFDPEVVERDAWTAVKQLVDDPEERSVEGARGRGKR